MKAGEKMGKYLSSKSALSEIGERLQAYRVAYQLSQKELADKSGVAVRCISRIENGEDVQFGNLIKVLIALELDANLDMLVQDPSKRPSYYLKEKTTVAKRKRVSKKLEIKPDSKIRWGDEKE